MAENKNSFILYCDLLHAIEHLTNEEKGTLFQHILEYVNDMNPILEDRMIIGSWKPIEAQLKRNLTTWEKTLGTRSDSGNLGNLKRWNLDLYKDVVGGIKTLEESLIIAKGRTAIKPVAKIAVSVSVSDSVINNTISDKVNFILLLDFFNKVTGKNSKVITDKVKAQINARLKDGYTKDDIAIAIKNCAKDEYHLETGLKYLTLEFITRQDKLEKYSTQKENLKPKLKYKSDRL